MKITHENTSQKLPIIILHGWKLRGQRYNDLIKLLKKDGHKVFAPDMPGFGSTPVTRANMMLSDYVSFVLTLLQKEKIEKAIFIGHSFGGRVAIKLAAEHPETIALLVLTGVPVIRQLSVKKRLAKIVASAGKKPMEVLPQSTQNLMRKILYRSIGEWDYYKAGELQTIFKNIISEDLVQYAKRIKTPTLLLWGETDTFTPAKDIEKIKKIMPQAKLVIFPDIGHSVPYTDPKLFFETLKKYL